MVWIWDQVKYLYFIFFLLYIIGLSPKSGTHFLLKKTGSWKGPGIRVGVERPKQILFLEQYKGAEGDSAIVIIFLRQFDKSKNPNPDSPGSIYVFMPLSSKCKFALSDELLDFVIRFCLISIHSF